MGSPHVTACGRVISHKHKHLVNRLKIPWGLSTLLFHRWSEVPSRGRVHSDSPYVKLPALQRCHLFSECLIGLLSELFFLVVLLFFLAFFRLCSSYSGFHMAPFWSECFILGLFHWPSSAQLLFYLVVLLCLALHRAPFILTASFWVIFIHFFYPCPSSSCDFGLFSV